MRCLGFITRSDFLQPAVLASTDGGGRTELEGADFSLSPTDSVDPNGEYSSGPFLAFKIQTTTALEVVRTTVNQEPDEHPGYDLNAED